MSANKSRQIDALRDRIAVLHAQRDLAWRKLAAVRLEADSWVEDLTGDPAYALQEKLRTDLSQCIHRALVTS